MAYPCPDEDCHRPCATDRMIAVDGTPYEDRFGNAICAGYCYQCHPPESFDIPYDEVKEFISNKPKPGAKKGAEYDLQDAVSELKSHIDSRASVIYEISNTELKPAFMATALGVSEKQMRRYLKDDVWKKKVGFPSAFITPESFTKWAYPIRNSRALAKAARDREKNAFKGARGKRKTDW